MVNIVHQLEPVKSFKRLLSPNIILIGYRIDWSQKPRFERQSRKSLVQCIFTIDEKWFHYTGYTRLPNLNVVNPKVQIFEGDSIESGLLGPNQRSSTCLLGPQNQAKSLWRSLSGINNIRNTPSSQRAPHKNSPKLALWRCQLSLGTIRAIVNFRPNLPSSGSPI